MTQDHGDHEENRDGRRARVSARLRRSRDALQARWDAADRRTALIAAGSLAGVLVVAAVAALLVAGEGTPDAPPARISVTPAGEEAPRLGPVVIAFREPPASTEAERLVSIERAPAAAVAGSGASVAAVADGTYAWLDDRTLLFQPDFPGFQRGAQYLVRVDGDAAGGGADFTQEFTVEGKLTVRSVIPGAADQDVPSEARIFVQFSRSVAPLTVLAEQSTDAVIEFEPALPGSGEWLNTSLYVFTPDDLQPSTTYRGRIAAGLTSAADGVLEEDFEWEFSTFQPALASSTPAAAVSFVPPDATVELVFNQPMDRASTEAGVDLLLAGASRVAVDAAWSEDDTTLTLTPRDPLSISTRYSVRVDAGIAGAAGGATQAERTLSFTTVDMPEVVSISPRDGETAASRYGVQIQFNNPMDMASVEDRISISGLEREDWRFNSYEPQWLHLDVQFQPSTTYTVEIAAGAVDRAGLALPPMSVTFTTGQEPPSVSYAIPAQMTTYAASGEQELFFFVSNMPSVDFELYALTEGEADEILRTNQIPRPGAPDYRPQSDPIRTWSEAVEASPNSLVQGMTTLGGEEPLAPGYYYVRSPGGSWNGAMFFAVVDTVLVTKMAMDELVVWAMDHDSGEPVSGLSLRAQGPGIAGARLTTDAEGLASVSIPRPSEVAGNVDRNYRVATLDGPRFGVTRTDWATGTEPWLLNVPTSYWDQQMVAHVYTDRPIYRSGETVFFKAVARIDDDATYSLPPAGETDLTVVIFDAQGEEVLREPLTVNAYGTAAGSVQLPEEAATGFYNVSVREQRPGYENWVANAAFQVAEFRTPEFRVEAAPATPEVVDGDTIEVDVEASFFFGGPLEGADVTWTAHAHPGGVSFEGYERFSFADFDFFQSSIFEEPLRASGEATTDSRGIARLEVPGALRAGESTTVFDVSATVIDQSGQAIGGTASVTVHPAAVYAGIRTAEYLGRAGAPSEIQVASVDIDGEPAGGQPVTVEVYAREWVTVVEETDNGSRRYRSEPEDTLLETLSVTTGVDGLGSVSYTPSSSGVLRLVASTSDDAGRVASSAGYLWVSGQDFVRWEIRNDGIIELVADRDEYEVGGTAEVLVPAPFEGARALITIERGGILQRETRVFEGNSETLSIPIVDGFVPNVFVSVVLYRPPTEEDPVPRYHVGYVELPVSTETRTLSVDVQPSVEQAGPGETVSYDIRVTDSTGAPVQAEVAVNMVDAAVLSLSDLEGPTGLQAFWFQRGLGVRTGASVSVSVDRANDTVREPAFGGKGGGEEGEALRSEFRNTAYWEAQLETNAQGVATFEVQLPDNLTTWRTQVRAVSGDTLVGEGTHDLLATKPLLVRPALPRFVRAGDQVMLRTLVRNATDDAQDVTVSIEVDGLDLDDGAEQTLTVQPDQSGEFEWPASASATGTATVAFRAAAPGLADAVEISLPVYLDVTPETMATGGVVVGESQLEALYLPPYAIVDNGELEVNVQGSLVGALHDELGKFASLPFEPSSRVASRVIGTVAAYLAEGEGGAGLVSAISFDMSKLQAMQRSDGGWGWCSGAGCRSDPMVTAWVLTAFGEAVEAGWDSPGTQWRRGDSYLRGHMNRTFDVRRPPDPNERAFMFYAIQHATDSSDYLNSLLALYENDRASLTAWGRAYLILGLLEAGQPADDRAVRGLVSDLNASVIPSANGNHWEDPPVYGSLESNVSMTALVLYALSEADPEHPLIEETARWVVAARDAQRWQSTIERAQALRGLGAFAALTGERGGEFDFDVSLDGGPMLSGRLAPGRGLNADAATLPLHQVAVGEVHHLSFQRETTLGRMYYVLNLRYVTPAAEVEAISRGLSVAHSYSLLGDAERPVTQARLGDIVRVSITVVADADRKFVQVEDFLPAGLEAIDAQLATVPDDMRRQLEAERQDAVAGEQGDGQAYAPWYRWYWSPWDETNVRDDRFTMFATELPRGVHEYVYYARATTPGDFFVAPAHAEEGPFPEVFGRSDSGRFTVTH